MDTNNGGIIESALTICQDSGNLPCVPCDPLSASLHTVLGSRKACTPSSESFCRERLQSQASVGDGRNGGE